MKSKGHIYMANVLLNDLNKGKGKLKIGDVTYTVPKKVYEVLKKYPKYFRAGAVGPDFFPDMIIGQTDIHPVKSGDFVNLMYNELLKLPQGSKFDQSFAFYLGYTMHYACDAFSHYYINSYAGGFFPDISSVISIDFPKVKFNEEYLDIILKHITIESYLDNKVHDQDFSIKIPNDYLKRCFGTKEAWENIGKIVEHNDFEILRLMVDQYARTLKSGNDFKSRDSQDAQKRIDQWFDEWAKYTTSNLTPDSSFDFNKISSLMESVKAKNNSKIILIQFLLYVYSYTKNVKPVIDFIIAPLKYLNPLYPITELLELEFYHNILTELYKQTGTTKDLPKTTSKCKEEIRKIIVDFVTHPENVLNKFKLFEPMREKYKCTKLTDYFDKEWGNFGKFDDCESQDFHVFRQCLNMGKLCLIGNENLNAIAKEYGAKKYVNHFKDGIFDYRISRLKVTVKVADEKNAGVNADVFLSVEAKDKTKTAYILDSKSNDFERKSSKSYKINLKKKIKVADLKNFELSFKCSNLLMKIDPNNSKFIVASIKIEDDETGIVLAEITKKSTIKKDAALKIPVKLEDVLAKYEG